MAKDASIFDSVDPSVSSDDYILTNNEVANNDMSLADIQNQILQEDKTSTKDLPKEIILPQADEFTCSICHLVKHNKLLAKTVKGKPICVDCV
jgi:hypothetical protein